MSAKQDKRAKTLLEYMGFKDPDIKSNEHDDWCLRLLDEQIIKNIFYSKQKIVESVTREGYHEIIEDNNLKILQLYPYTQSWNGVCYTFSCGCYIKWNEKHIWGENRDVLDYAINTEECNICKEFEKKRGGSDNCWECRNSKTLLNFIKEHKQSFEFCDKICKKYNTWLILDYVDFEKKGIRKNIEIKTVNYTQYEYIQIEKIEKQLEKVLSNSTNNFRFGFLDVYAKIYYTKHIFLVDKNKIIKHKVIKSYNGDPIINEIILFFEVKINQPTLGEITREIEYYKDVIKTVYHQQKILPFVISSKKYFLPEQFDCLSFDEFNTIFPKKGKLDMNIIKGFDNE